jgi:hypothetical protein
MMSSIFSSNCKHKDQPHTAWYWVEDGAAVPFPYTVKFDNWYDMMEIVGTFVAENGENSRLRWIKGFRSDNETYTCFRWSNPLPYEPPKATYVPPVERDNDHRILQLLCLFGIVATLVVLWISLC